MVRIDQAEQQGPPSLRYWDADDDRRIQRYYIALCLLMAAIQDALLGKVERRFKNLNWSATVSYYSLVHSGRLVAFVALGDYPTQHGQLRQLFFDRNHRVELDWLDKHRGLAGVHAPPKPRTSLGEVAARLDELGLNVTDQRLRQFGAILSASAQLRNDSNYEALLVAHEYQHTLVSLAFERLSAALAQAAEEGLGLAIDAFNLLRREAPASFGPAIESLVDDFLHERVVPAIQSKIRGFEEAERLLHFVGGRLQTDAPARRNVQLERRLELQFFTGKTRLMDRFRQRIIRLEEALGTFDAEHWAEWYTMPQGLPEWQE